MPPKNKGGRPKAVLKSHPPMPKVEPAPAVIEIMDKPRGRPKGRTRGRGIDGSKTNSAKIGQDRMRVDFEPFVKVMVGDFARGSLHASVNPKGGRVLQGLAAVVRAFPGIKNLTTGAVREFV